MNGIRGIKLTECYLVKIKYEDPEGVIYKNMKATKYPKFLEDYPEKALSKGLKLSEIKVLKKFESQEDFEID